MKRLAKIVAVIVVVLVGLHYAIVTPGVSLRYRMTVKVAVNGVTHTGSGVVEITYQTFRDWVIESVPVDWSSRFRGSVKGYAITIDLGDRGLLFIVNSIPLVPGLVGGPTLDELPFYAYRSIFSRNVQRHPTSGPPSEVMDRARMIQNAKREPIVLVAQDLPMIVLLAANGARNSAEEVDPRDIADTVGSGARLESVTFELTRDPVTPMPRIWPEWLKSATDEYLRFAHQQLAGGVVGTSGIHISEFKGD